MITPRFYNIIAPSPSLLVFLGAWRCTHHCYTRICTGDEVRVYDSNLLLPNEKYLAKTFCKHFSSLLAQIENWGVWKVLTKCLGRIFFDVPKSSFWSIKLRACKKCLENPHFTIPMYAPQRIIFFWGPCHASVCNPTDLILYKQEQHRAIRTGALWRPNNLWLPKRRFWNVEKDSGNTFCTHFSSLLAQIEY